MKFRDFTGQFSRVHIWLALCLSSPLVASSDAQELFRVGRPDYARSQRVVRPNAAPTSAFTPNRSIPLPTVVSPSGSPFGSPSACNQGEFVHVQPRPAYQLGVAQAGVEPDYERVQLAWENFQREVSEYRARYGGEANPRMPRSVWRGGRPGYSNVRPAGFTGSRITPAAGGYPTGGLCSDRGCRPRGTNLAPRDLAPRDLAPADLPPRLSGDVRVSPYREAPALRNERRPLVGEWEALEPQRSDAGRYDSLGEVNQRRRVSVPKHRATDSYARRQDYGRQVIEPSRSQRSNGALERWRSNELRDSQLRDTRRDFDSRERVSGRTLAPRTVIDPRNSASRSESNRGSVEQPSMPAPIQPIDPTKIASRARDFFRSHLSE